ncbi:MAG: hypothetical protein J5525_12490 [Lachnospiraceae bacterium]|nr:hypothetical protein [Lachnospiraceae bacterium]
MKDIVLVAANMENMYKNMHQKLWNRLTGESLSDTWDKFEKYTYEIRNVFRLPCVQALSMHTIKRWSKTRIIYRFGSEMKWELFDMASKMQEDEDIPAQFLRLPYDAISIQLEEDPTIEDMLMEMIGKLNENFGMDTTMTITTAKAGEICSKECIINVLTSPYGTYSLVLPIGNTIGDSMSAAMDFIENSPHWLAKDIRRSIKESEAYKNGDFDRDTYKDIIVSSLKWTIQFILYLNAINSDQQKNEDRLKEDNVPRQKRKEIKRDIEKARVQLIDVGYHVGKLIKQAKLKEEPEKQTAGPNKKGGKKRAHFRRAHWHHFWTGKRDGEQELVLKWVQMTTIHEDEIDDKPTLMEVR